MSASSQLARAIPWAGRFLAYVAAIVLAGGIVGGVLFPLLGVTLRMEYPVAHMARRGFLDLSFYALIWAPAISLVACVMQARSRSRERRNP